MKKLLTGIAGALIMGCLISPIKAEDTRNMALEYMIPNTYTIQIPANITLSKNETTASITASKMNIEPGKTAQVKVTSGINTDKSINLHRTGDTSTVAKTQMGLKPIKNVSECIANNTVVASFTGQEVTPLTGGGTLYFNGLLPYLPAGTYTGTLTFSIEVV